MPQDQIQHDFLIEIEQVAKEFNSKDNKKINSAIERYTKLLDQENIESFQEEFKKIKVAKLSGVIKEKLAQLHIEHARIANSPSSQEFHLNIAHKYQPSAELCLERARFYSQQKKLEKSLSVLTNFGNLSNHSKLYWEYIHTLKRLCDFKRLKLEKNKMLSLITKGSKDANPLALKWLGYGNEVSFQTSKILQQDLENQQDFIFTESKNKNKKLRVAYISSQFVEHAVSHQLGNTFFKEHLGDIEIFLYSMKGDGSSPSEKRCANQVKRYIDISGMSNEDAIRLIREHKIDIFINLCGWADYHRPYFLMCKRVAPIQIDYLGYPGSSGSNFVDYYLGDPISTPISECEKIFSEKLVLLPPNYQPAEHKEMYPNLNNEKLSISECRELLKESVLSESRTAQLRLSAIINKNSNTGSKKISSAPSSPLQSLLQRVTEYLGDNELNPSLAKLLIGAMNVLGYSTDITQDSAQIEKYIEQMLPNKIELDGKFKFATVCNHMKLSIVDINLWARVLDIVPNSVILFHCSSLEAQKNILEAFPQNFQKRVHFVGFVHTKEMALQRLRVADVVLDSNYYGGHSNTCDAIWSGVPIITKLGNTVETRVCSSMLSAANLTELITHTDDEYLELALKIASDKAYRESLNEKVYQARESYLFDRSKFCENLSRAYRQLWVHFCDDKEPEHMDFSHL